MLEDSSRSGYMPRCTRRGDLAIAVIQTARTRFQWTAGRILSMERTDRAVPPRVDEWRRHRGGSARTVDSGVVRMGIISQ